MTHRAPYNDGVAVWSCSRCLSIYRAHYPRCPRDGARIVVAEHDPLVGATIGHYAIDAFIGEGAMSRVYSAHHAKQPQRRFALKVLIGDAAAESRRRQRFAREAASVRRLMHPIIVRVYEHAQTLNGLLYIVMDLVDGQSLSAEMKTPMEASRVVEIARGICAGLGHAHARGVIHRDLKPENVLMTRDGKPHIVDFGFALTAEHERSRLTSVGNAVGTPAYAAPEQVLGRAIDQRADLYALGMTMFELLTGGILPFEGSGAEMAAAKVYRCAPAIGDCAPRVHVIPELEAIVMRLLARRPRDRFADARAVIEALDGFDAGVLLDDVATSVLDYSMDDLARTIVDPFAIDFDEWAQTLVRAS